MGRVWRRKGTAHGPKPSYHLSNEAANGTGSLVFIDDMTGGRSSRMSSEMYEALLSAQIQPNVAKLLPHSTDG